MSRRGQSVAVAVVASAALALTYWRLFYGVDFTDEAYYVEIPYRFVLGARPFVDETTPSQQGAGLLTYPVFAAYHALFGVSGVMLFARHMHLLFSCFVAVCAYLGVRPYVRTTAWAVLPSLLPVAFVAFNVPGLDYNNLGSGFFTAGCFLGLRTIPTGRRTFAAGAGLLHGLSIFVYPPLVLPTLVYALVLATLAGNHRRQTVGLYSAAAAIPVAVLGVVVLNAGTDHVRAVYSHAQEFGNQGGGIGKAWSLVVDVAFEPFAVSGALLLAIAVLLLWRRRPSLVGLLLPVSPLFFIQPSSISEFVASLYYVRDYGLFAAPLFVGLRNDDSSRRLFLAVWPAALVAGLAMALSSNNGLTNFGLGFLPAAIVTTVLLETALEGFWRGSRALPLAVLTCGTIPVAILVALQFTSVYRDAHFGALDARVAHGPYAGIATTSRTRDFIETMTTDLRHLSPPRCRILFYDHFPAGYLMSRSHAYTNAVYLLVVSHPKVAAYRRVLLRYYDAHGGPPDVVVRMSDIPGTTGKRLASYYSRGDPLDRIVLRSRAYRLALRRPDYTISYRRDAPCLRARS